MPEWHNGTARGSSPRSSGHPGSIPGSGVKLIIEIKNERKRKLAESNL